MNYQSCQRECGGPTIDDLMKTVRETKKVEPAVAAMKVSPKKIEPEQPPVMCAKACPFNYDPVCGSDGKDYSNQCVMESVNCNNPSPVVVAYKGECRKEDNDQAVEPPLMCAKACPFIMDPVCGTDGKDYSNQCVLESVNCNKPGVTVAYKGECRGAPDPLPPTPPPLCAKFCAQEYKPVCGSDGKTYSSKCKMENANCGKQMTVAYEGECKAKNGKCTAPPDTGVCMANFQNYYFDPATATCKTFTFGGCGGNENNYNTKEECEAACVVPKKPCVDHGHVHAHGETYSHDCNTCFCNDGNTACTTMACPPTPPPPTPPVEPTPPLPPLCATACPMHYAPVCGSDGQTYSNACTLKSLNCNKPGVTLAHAGPCEQVKRPCEYEGKTYNHGDSIKVECNSCMCNDGVMGGCTMMACPEPQPPPVACMEPRKVGVCRAAMPRFAYNPEAQKCEPFIYGGCQGNNNNFMSYDECQRMCGGPLEASASQSSATSSADKNSAAYRNSIYQKYGQRLVGQPQPAAVAGQPQQMLTSQQTQYQKNLVTRIRKQTPQISASALQNQRPQVSNAKVQVAEVVQRQNNNAQQRSVSRVAPTAQTAQILPWYYMFMGI